MSIRTLPLQLQIQYAVWRHINEAARTYVLRIWMSLSSRAITQSVSDLYARIDTRTFDFLLVLPVRFLLPFMVGNTESGSCLYTRYARAHISPSRYTEQLKSVTTSEGHRVFEHTLLAALFTRVVAVQSRAVDCD